MPRWHGNVRLWQVLLGVKLGPTWEDSRSSKFGQFTKKTIKVMLQYLVLQHARHVASHENSPRLRAPPQPRLWLGIFSTGQCQNRHLQGWSGFIDLRSAILQSQRRQTWRAGKSPMKFGGFNGKIIYVKLWKYQLIVFFSASHAWWHRKTLSVRDPKEIWVIPTGCYSTGFQVHSEQPLGE